jgi:hypothetical protein
MRGENADAATERKPRASTSGAPPPRVRRYSSDSTTCLFALTPNGSAHTTLTDHDRNFESSDPQRSNSQMDGNTLIECGTCISPGAGPIWRLTLGAAAVLWSMGEPSCVS